MIRLLTLLSLLIFAMEICYAQTSSYQAQLDSLLNAKTERPFNGIVLIVQNGGVAYNKTYGYADLAHETPLNSSHQFVIGSISKQITAVLVLQEYEKGRIKLHVPIRTYLPALPQPWADSVTVHQLLTHTHGIHRIDQPLKFKAGSQYAYSQLGYELLAQIVERTSQKTFEQASAELFAKCGILNTHHPAINKHKSLVTAYTEGADGRLDVETEMFEHYVAAGGFVSTAPDLALWNQHLFGGKLLSRKTMQLLTTKHKGAVRNHSLFGITAYGYGITVDTKNDILQWGQTGYTPGFVSMNFYYPKTKTSLIVLSNIAYGGDNFNTTFYHHIEIQKILRESELVRKGGL
jgi:D-alanyl-D-alanine carboxypeptidase